MSNNIISGKDIRRSIFSVAFLQYKLTFAFYVLVSMLGSAITLEKVKFLIQNFNFVTLFLFEVKCVYSFLGTLKNSPNPNPAQ